jgi:polar amino acid transport system substrate-binding protein
VQHINGKVVRIGAAALAVLLALAAAWWFQSRDDSLARLQKSGVLRVGYSVGEPFAEVDAGGVPHGMGVDNIPKLARSLGLSRIEWVQTSYAELIPDLLDRRYDVVAAQLIISPDRQRGVGFSDPVTPVRYSVLVPAGNPGQVGPYSQLLPRPDLTVAVVHESLASTELRARGFTDAMLQEVAESSSGEAALRVGAVRALVLTDRAVQAISQRHPAEFQIVAEPKGSGGPSPAAWMAYVFHPDDGALRRAWNGALRHDTPAPAAAPGSGT